MPKSFLSARKAAATLLNVLILHGVAMPQVTQKARPKVARIAIVTKGVKKSGKTAKPNAKVRLNELLETNNAGKVKLTMADGSVLSMGNASDLRIVHISSELQQVSVQLNNGKLRSTVVAFNTIRSSFVVQTPFANASVLGTDFIVLAKSDHTTVICNRGQVLVSYMNTALSQVVVAGHFIEATAAGLGIPQVTPEGLQLSSAAETDVTPEATPGAGGGRGMERTVIAIVLAGGAVLGILVTNAPGKTPISAAAP